MKRIKLHELKSVDGSQFRDIELDGEGRAALVLQKDTNGNPVMRVPRDDEGNPVPNTSPEPSYINKTKVPKSEECLPMLLKRFYFNIPREAFTRQDSIYGLKMFRSVDKIKGGWLELDDDVHKWIRDKLQAKFKDGRGGTETEIGVAIFSLNLAVFEEALDDFERTVEPSKK